MQLGVNVAQPVRKGRYKFQWPLLPRRTQQPIAEIKCQRDTAVTARPRLIAVVIARRSSTSGTLQVRGRYSETERDFKVLMNQVRLFVEVVWMTRGSSGIRHLLGALTVSKPTDVLSGVP